MSLSSATTPTMGSALTTQKNDAAPKPCCVCKEEKSSRDECMLFSNARNPEKDCATTIDKYKSCMAGFGFSLP